MFFWLHKKLKTISKKASLLTCHNHINPVQCDNILKPKNKTKRTFSFSPFLTEGSMCVEAAFSLSFFLIFFVNIFSIVFLYVSYIRQLEVLQEKGKKYAIYTVANPLNLQNERLIELEDSVAIKSSLPFLGYGKGEILLRCIVKPWTGYEDMQGLNTAMKEEMVYMTEYGSVYHRQRSCSHLSLSLKIVSYAEIRREYAGYRACEICYQDTGQQEFGMAAYVTMWGDRYHRSVNCRSLKRSIKCVPISQVKGIPECQKCG